MSSEICVSQSIKGIFNWSIPSINLPVGGILESKQLDLLQDHKFKFKIVVASPKKLYVFLRNVGTYPAEVSVKQVLREYWCFTFKNLCPEKVILRPYQQVKVTKIKGVFRNIFFYVYYSYKHLNALNSFAFSNHNTLEQNLTVEWMNPELADWTLICQDDKFQCHRAILGARSDVFKAQFLSVGFLENGAHQTEIKDMTKDTLKALLRFVYSDELETDNVSVKELYIAADMYNIPLLKDKCLKYLEGNITTENVLEYFSLSDMYNEMSLKNKASVFIGQNITKLQGSEEWTRFLESKGLEEVIRIVSK